jgi:DNA-binding CsgD family transcriptional regulator
MADEDLAHGYESDERYATLRGRHLSKTTALGVAEATAVAWSELGYSRRAIAREMGVGSSTVKSYHERAMVLYGLEILETHVPDAEETDYERVGSEYVAGLSPFRARVWREAFERQRRGLPEAWVAEVHLDTVSDADSDG